MVFYIKLFFIILWFLISSLLTFCFGVLTFGRGDVNRFYARVLSWGILNIIGIRVQIQGEENIEAQKPVIYVANHQSYFDVITFGGYYPKRTVIIGKKEVAWIPVFGVNFVLAGNVLIDRKNASQAVTGLTQVVEAIKKRKVSIWIFPEGTRNRAGKGLLPFKKGPFHMAIQAQVPIVGFISAPLEPFVSWKHRRLKGGVLKIQIVPLASAVNCTVNDLDRLIQQTREKMLTAVEAME